METSGIILAAGRGERLGGRGSKAFLELGGKPLLSWCVEAFLAAGEVEELVVVVPPGEVDRARSILKPVPRAWKLAVGGQRRQDSAWAGLEAAGGSWVLLHDVARPLVSPDLIRRVLRAAKAHGAAVPVLPAVDTMRYLDGEFLAPKTLDRAGLVRVQTPQGFSRDLLLLAYQRAREQGRDLPDDAAALLALGKRVAAVPGEPANLKLTYPEDRKLLLALVKNLYRH